MIGRLTLLATFAAAFLVASTARTMGADPPGLSAHGTIVAQARVNGTPMNLGGEIALMTRGKQLRVDLIKLGVPGTDPALNALITQFLPQGGISLVFDQGTGAMMIWSDAKRKFYVFKAANATPAPQPSATQEPTFGSSIVEMMESGKFFKDYAVFSESVVMGARSTVNGHPASNLHVQVKMQKHGGSLTDTSADVALAEDQQYLPLRIAVTVKPQNYSARIDFTQISAASPDPSVFSTPAGYTQAADPSEIFGTALPH